MNAIKYLKSRKYFAPRPEICHDKEAGVLDLQWRVDNETWAILQIGEQTDSDFSLCAHGPGGKIKMKGTATKENLDVVIEFTTHLMKD